MRAKFSAAKSLRNSSRPPSLGQLLRWKRHWGLYSRVARRLKLSPQHVQKVASGERRSRRVEHALAEELRKLGTA
jgi:hypothetical protein